MDIEGSRERETRKPRRDEGRKKKSLAYRVGGLGQPEPAQLVVVGVEVGRSLEEPPEGAQQAILVVHQEYRVQQLTGHLT